MSDPSPRGGGSSCRGHEAVNGRVHPSELGAPSRVGSRLAGPALDRQDRWTENGFVNRLGRWFPPQPIRYSAGSMATGSNWNPR